jgi:hypothetical protein
MDNGFDVASLEIAFLSWGLHGTCFWDFSFFDILQPAYLVLAWYRSCTYMSVSTIDW